MASHDPSDIAARDAEVCRAAVLPLRAHCRTGEAGEHRVPDVDRLLNVVGLEFVRRSRGAHTCHQSTRSPSGAITHRRGRRWVHRARLDSHHGVRAAELVGMERTEPGQDLLTAAGQAARALLAPGPDPMRVSPALRIPSRCIVPRFIVLRDKKHNDMDARGAERPPDGGALC